VAVKVKARVAAKAAKVGVGSDRRRGKDGYGAPVAQDGCEFELEADYSDDDT